MREKKFSDLHFRLKLSVFTQSIERGNIRKKYKTKKNGRLHKTEINNECRRKCELSIDLGFSFFANFSFWLITLYLLKPSWLLYVPPGLNTNSTFCPHSVIYVFCVDLRTNNDYFPIQH